MSAKMKDILMTVLIAALTVWAIFKVAPAKVKAFIVG